MNYAQLAICLLATLPRIAVGSPGHERFRTRTLARFELVTANRKVRVKEYKPDAPARAATTSF